VLRNAEWPMKKSMKLRHKSNDVDWNLLLTLIRT
jgi:hypothetical protein